MINKEINKNRSHSYKISRNFLKSIKYALNGIIYNFQNNRNFRIQSFCALIVLIIGFNLNLKFIEYMILISTIISVLVLELLNTSIETIVDLIVNKNYNKLAMVSKDCSAAAVLLASLNSIFVALYLFLPKIRLLFN